MFAAVGYTTLVVRGRPAGRAASGFSFLLTAFVAVAFQPVRRRVVRLANRLAYGPRAQPYEELADFSSRLVETPSVDRLLLPRSPPLPARHWRPAAHGDARRTVRHLG